MEKVEIPKVEGDVTTLPPPYTVRVLFLYGRNNCPLQFQKQDVSRLTLCVPMDSSFWFYTIHLGWSIVYIEWSQVIISNFFHIFSLLIDFVLGSSADPDEMQQCMTFHLGLHCLPKYPFRGFRYTKG